MALFRHAIFALGVGFVCFAPISAEARCTKIGWNQKYDPAKSIGTDFFYETDNGSCSVTHSIPSGQGAYKYTNTRVVEGARNGTVKYVSLTKWQYRAKPGFTGKDNFKLEVCAESTLSKGCSLIIYELRVTRI